MIQKKKKKTVNMSSKKKLKKYFEANDNENTIQNLWDTAKSVHSRKFTVIQDFLKKQETSQVNNLIHHLKESE